MIRTYASVAPVVDTSDIAEYFHKSTTVGYLITSMFLLGYVFGPAWGPGAFSRSIFRVPGSLSLL